MITQRQAIATEVIRVASANPALTDSEVCQIVSNNLKGVLVEHVEAVIADGRGAPNEQ